jgi:hypothetical protein
MRDLQDILDTTEVGMKRELRVTINRLDGHLCIWKTGPMSYNVRFSIPLLCKPVTPVDVTVATPDAVVQLLRDLKMARFSFDAFIKEDKFPAYLEYKTAICAVLDTTPETCSVCLEDAFGFYSRCRHEICLRCYLKVIANTDRFVCPVCRDIVRCDCGDHLDEEVY